MPTKKPRLNITFDATEVNMLTKLAKQEHKSIAGLAKELILEALERREDMALSAIADSRIEEAEKKSSKTIAHKNAWK